MESEKQLNLEKFLNNRENISILGKFLFKKIFESTSAKKNFYDLLNEYENNKIYEDKSFPPNENSLVKGYFHNNANKNIISNKWSKIKWIRSSEIFNNPKIFNKEIDPNEIKQGALNNCSFLSILAALSEYPDRVKSLFIIDKINLSGIYGVRLCIDGEWSEIIIDDFFPCDMNKKVCCFSHGDGNSLWVQIIEKCYAKAYGSYHKLEQGLPENVMRDLTGAASITLDNSNENLLNALKEACEKRWIITASSSETSASKDLLKEVGLISLHSYTILEVHEFHLDNDINSHTNLSSINHGNNNVEFLLKIRNPWGKNEWIGDWSDFSNLWKDNLNFSNSNSNGCFFMNFKDFKHYFSKIQICKYFDNYNYTSIKLIQNLNQYCLVKMSLSNESTLPNFISLIHPDKKKSNLFYNNLNDNKYFVSRFIISKINKFDSFSISDDGVGLDKYSHLIEYIGGKMGNEREVFDERILEAGEYLIYIEIDWSIPKDSIHYEINKSYPFVLSTYSNNKIELNQINNEEYPQILESIYKSCAKKNNNFVRYTNEGAPNCYKFTNETPEGYTYIYFENNEIDATLIEDVKYTKFEGLKLLSPFSGTSYYIEIGPGQSQIVLIKQVDMSGFNIIYSYHSNFLFGSQRLLELTKLKGKKSYRKDTKLNIDVEIVVYTYKYSFGLCFFYENNTQDRKLEETLKIKSTGVEIVDCENIDNNILIVLGPGENRLIELRAKKNNWSVQSSVSYKIESL